MLRAAVLVPVVAATAVGGLALVLKLVDRARRKRSMRARSREAAIESIERARGSARESVQRARGPMHRGLAWTQHRVSRIRKR